MKIDYFIEWTNSYNETFREALLGITESDFKDCVLGSLNPTIKVKYITSEEFRAKAPIKLDKSNIVDDKNNHLFTQFSYELNNK